ncbi:hypothetical protein ACLESO_22655 [Pyxidicoccus sp. 3LG]
MRRTPDDRQRPLLPRRVLRHDSELDRHPVTRERIVCSSELPFELRPRDVRIVEAGAAVDIDWGDRADDSSVPSPDDPAGFLTGSRAALRGSARVAERACRVHHQPGPATTPCRRKELD